MKMATATCTATCPTGKQTVTVTVIKAEYRTAFFNGHARSSMKITVKSDDGWRAWGTCPGNLELIDQPCEFEGETWTEQRTITKGDRLTFTATFFPSDDDPGFGFFKRPSKGVLLTEETETVTSSEPQAEPKAAPATNPYRRGDDEFSDGE